MSSIPPPQETPSSPSSQPADRREAVGAAYSLAAMRAARERSTQAVQRVAQAIRPGMTEGDAVAMAKALLLNELGADRTWHPVIIRFGEATLKTFKQRSDPARVLGEQDIFFVDIGPVWGGHEGDAGDTFVVGGDPEMQACTQAARALWREVAARWRHGGESGMALYRHAAERAQAMGWRLNLEIKGHRVCDFPHAIHRGGDLGDYDGQPAEGVWVLEIQIAHLTRPFGAFYEELLIHDDA